MHGLCGFWAIVARGIFDTKHGFFSTGLSEFLGIQILGGIVITIWAALLSFFFFYSVKLQSRLRISVISEIVGADFINKSKVYDMKQMENQVEREDSQRL